ncbi:MAG: hypothetical protein WCA35_13340 [Kovacikia sp.]
MIAVWEIGKGDRISVLGSDPGFGQGAIAGWNAGRSSQLGRN